MCDNWIESVLEDAGVILPKEWKRAKDTNIDKHIVDIKDLLLSSPKPGFNIVFLEQGKTGKYASHAQLIYLNEEGKVTLYQMGQRAWATNKTSFPTLEEYRIKQTATYKDDSTGGYQYAKIHYFPIE